VQGQKFQPTHPHGVRLFSTLKRSNELYVSTHAPARGATLSILEGGLIPQSFNPRTRTGCDRLGLLASETLAGFNPRTRTGCDRQWPLRCLPPLTVSTHAPARGATPVLLGPFTLQQVSTHAPARGATFLTCRTGNLQNRVSTHAPARGATQMAHIHLCNSPLFQPTHPHGVRHHPHLDVRAAGASVSTHAPARGATRRLERVCRAIFVSTHAPARGATAVVILDS